MKGSIYILAVLSLVISSCVSVKKSTMPGSSFDFEGHRGSRGLMPENTIPAMKAGIDNGITTVELDAIITKDNKVVVSHDPYFSDVITTTPDGKYLTKKEAEKLALYKMTYDEIEKYDVGMKPHPGFPQQQKIKVHKPLLSVLIDSVESYAASKGKLIRYNIEIKSKSTTDGIYHPAPEPFSELLIDVLKDKHILDRTVIQSFDVRPLQYIHAKYPSIKLSYLVEATAAPLQDEISKLGFIPDTYSPNFAIVTKELVQQCHQKGIKVLPWTVDTVSEMKRLIVMGVDGIITDYPNLFAELKDRN
jgi:glycerophosphoryl diester phosphodiesterase